MEPISFALSLRRFSCLPPCTMPKSACLDSKFRLCAVRERRAQRCVRSIASLWYSYGSVGAVHSSKAKNMSAPRACWISMERSGVNRCREPSKCEVNVTPSSSMTANCPCWLWTLSSYTAIPCSRGNSSPLAIFVTDLPKAAPSENTWKPPESVMVGPSHPINFPSPPALLTSSSPGWRYR